MASPSLVAESERTAFLGTSRHSLYRRYQSPVPDNKTMVGLVYRSAAAAPPSR
jgi:hypothetical protein